ncbi:hypothetical protein F5Y17DRAFT_463959 [Xylariaceae sp. FL0594]|nr:hypothetical protein F5Y17DRAFT_463959 [Xylariaceae sp. FL0594]
MKLATLKQGTVANKQRFHQIISMYFTPHYQPLIPWVVKLRDVVFPNGESWEKEDLTLYSRMRDILGEAQNDSSLTLKDPANADHCIEYYLLIGDKGEHLRSAASSPALLLDPIFPSSHQLDYVASDISPIPSEIDLRHFERDTVEEAVRRLVNEAYNYELLRVHLGILGSVTFESHTNLGDTVDAISQSVEQMTMAENTAANATTTPAPKQARARRKARRDKKGPADQFCVYRRSDGRNVPALAIEYKGPHKLTRDEVVADLRGEIQASIFSGANAILFSVPYLMILLTCFSASRVLSSKVFPVVSTAKSSAYPHLHGSPPTSSHR